MFNNIIQFFIYSLVVFLSGFIIISLYFIVFTFIIILGDISILEIKDILYFNLYMFSRMSPLIVLVMLISKKLRGS